MEKQFKSSTKGTFGDVYMPDPGTVKEAHCGICKEIMTVKRDCVGPTSSIMAMGGSKRNYDSFYCPHRDTNWHKQVKVLQKKAKETPSKTLEEIYLSEAKNILATRKATKEIGFDWW